MLTQLSFQGLGLLASYQTINHTAPDQQHSTCNSAICWSINAGLELMGQI